MSRSSVFKRLERDDEFRARLKADEDWPKLPAHAQIAILTASGGILDDYAWGYCRVQRKIIDDWT